ncbi:VacJ family lipoprotein [Candidatus Sumerlaeota bacterium]
MKHLSWGKKMLAASLCCAWLGLLASGLHAQTGEQGTTTQDEDRRKALDILMPVNYAFYWINDPFQRFVSKPIAVGYSYIIPRPARHGINNLQNNLLTPFKAINNLLQGKVKKCGTEFARFGINTTVGVLGLFEVAEPKFGLEPNPEDLGQTLGKWYIHEGPYLCLPILGPTTLRDMPFILTMTRESVEWYRGETLDPIQLAAGWSIFMINGKSLTYGSYDQSRKAAKMAGVSHYRFIRDNYVDRRYREVKDLPPRR